MSENPLSDSSVRWLIFFFICFIATDGHFGGFAIFTYNANAPEPKRSSAHGGMLLPQDGEYAPHAQVWTVV